MKNIKFPVASEKVLVQCSGALNGLRENEGKINELEATMFERASAQKNATEEG